MEIWRPFQRENYYSAWKDKNILGVLQEFCSDLRRCYERIWRGYCDYDIFSIDQWFLGIMPTMLEDFKNNSHGCPLLPNYSSDDMNDKTKAYNMFKDWQAILEKMIFLLKEADEETCSRQNPYQEQYDKACEEFNEKYGFFGEKLLTEEEKKSNFSRCYMLSDVEEYKPISDLYFNEYSKLEEYRKKCKDEALIMFSRWFYDLWD